MQQAASFVPQERTPAEREVVETVGHQFSAAYRKLRGFLGLVAADRHTLTSVLGVVFLAGVD